MFESVRRSASAAKRSNSFVDGDILKLMASVLRSFMGAVCTLSLQLADFNARRIGCKYQRRRELRHRIDSC